MEMREKHIHRIAEIVLTIELEMRRNDLWSKEVPTPEAMASRQPFCCDTLDFREWLQYIFLPRMRHILENGDPLPNHSNITAMAEEDLPHREVDTGRLLGLLREFDRLISD